MKVSNNTNIARIYQEQLKKLQGDKSGEAFKKVMQDAGSAAPTTRKEFHPPSGINPSNQVFTGKPVAEVDPNKTVEFAAEVVAQSPDIRQERIDRIAGLIAKGQYNVPPEKVAEALLATRSFTDSWEG